MAKKSSSAAPRSGSSARNPAPKKKKLPKQREQHSKIAVMPTVNDPNVKQFSKQEIKAGKKEMLISFQEAAAKEAAKSDELVQGVAHLAAASAGNCDDLLVAATSRARDHHLALTSATESEVAELLEAIADHKQRLETTLKRLDSASTKLYNKEVGVFESEVAKSIK